MLGGRESNEKNTFLTSPQVLWFHGASPSTTVGHLCPFDLPGDTGHIFWSSTQVHTAFQGQGHYVSRRADGVVGSKRSGGKFKTIDRTFPESFAVRGETDRRCLQRLGKTWKAIGPTLRLSHLEQTSPIRLHSPRHFSSSRLPLLGTTLATRQRPVASRFALWCFRKFLPKLVRIKNKHIVHW